MRRHRSLPSALLALTLVVGVTACGDDGTEPPDGRSSLTILLTDAPGDVRAAVVTISEISLQGGEAEGEAEGSIVLMSEPTTVDLLTLQADFQALVQGQTVESGSYGQLRFVIDGGYVEVEGESETESTIFATSADYAGLPAGAEVGGELHCPSCGQSGFKVNFAGALVLDEPTEQILVDFDVSESFGAEAGASGRWIMNPTLKGTDFGAAAEVSVALTLGEGVSLPMIGGAAVAMGDLEAELTGASGDVESATFVEGSGSAQADFGLVLTEDAPYTLRIVAPAGLDLDLSPSVPMSVDLSAGASAILELTVTGVTVLP